MSCRGVQGLRLDGEVLHIGGGTGTMAAELARLFPSSCVTTTDIDPVMVQSARQQLRRLPNAQARQADATTPPFSDGSFDCVTSYLMLHHLHDWETAVAEVAGPSSGRRLRRLRPDADAAGPPRALGRPLASSTCVLR